MALALVVLRVCGENIKDGFCVDGKCFVVHQDSASFDAAQLVCQEKGGHLMTVRSEEAADVLGGLLSGASGDFWLGLKYQCSDSNDGLKGYRWVTGDNTTHYVNWKSDLTVCSPQCVSVSQKVLKWTERACNDRIEGYLCEYDNPGYCPPLSIDAPVSYQTHFGFTAKEELKEIPQFTIGTLQPLRTRHICVEGAWLQAPWSCEAAGGGCDYKCVQKGQSYACTCQPGFKPDINGVTCSKQDDEPCAHAECEHECARLGDAFVCTCRPGFHLGADGKSCEGCKPGFHIEGGVCVDDNECVFAPCEHYCNNTEGSYHCVCFQGYIQSVEDMHKCNMHCAESKCPANCDRNNNAQCNCPDGFLLEEQFCVDIDECDSGYCDHACDNSPGGFQCSCDEGFVLLGKLQCRENFEGSGSSTPFDSFIPTSRSPTDRPVSISAGSLLGIMLCIVLCILLLVCLARCIMRRLSKMHRYDVDKGHHEIFDFQQVIIEKHSLPQTFPSRYIKRDT
ncbi:thrombomodulin-like [Sinocyclocheilus anshuiensis]|uniref:thrombomodulin-like n=1 Tax=Sinocyclocheilus anshuiensis TaxID=1608454 RepID=UPI0007BA41B9|nr:PREDICTED: thrombomodulin-like [Sinocyclocheilus anshuiensis]